MKYFFLLLLSFSVVSCQNNPAKNDANVEVQPAWANEAVWYQIFPERFANGDPSNDPQPQDMQGCWPYMVPEGWQNHPWTSDWYELQEWEKSNGHDFYWNHGLRRYGGDLQGVLNKLDYLQELGITAIYFNPLFESPSLHKYDATMYHHIDNNFGPDAQGDRQIWALENPADPSTWRWTSADSLFLKLVAEVHKRQMKVIIDGVFNHVGTTFWAFDDVVRNQEQSEFRDWFVITRWDDPATTENEFQHKGWSGVKDLPEITETADGLNEAAAGHIRAVVKRWGDPDGDGDPADGIDGWRLDVAEMVPIPFWKQFRLWVKEVNPNAYITGEVWWQDWPNNKMFNAAPWLQGDVFDAVMNYRFGRALRLFIANDAEQINPQAFTDSLNLIYRDYSYNRALGLLNLTNSHDMERLASQIVNPDLWVDHGGNVQQNSKFNIRKPNDSERAKLKLLVALQMTLPGAPMIYYGDEAGMWGGDDPDCRKPMVWPELVYQPETAHPAGKARPMDEVVFDRSLFDWYKSYIHLRRQNQALSTGSLEYFLVDNEQGILGFSRQLAGQKIYVLINNSEKQTVVNFKLIDPESGRKTFTDLLTKNSLPVNEAKAELSLEPYGIVVLN